VPLRGEVDCGAATPPHGRAWGYRDQREARAVVTAGRV